MTGTVAVVVPARNEQDCVGACLDALAVAVAELRRATAVEAHTVVVLDDCRDATADVVASYPDVVTVRSTAGCVGSARRAGVAAALRRCAPIGSTWIASTDADCRVPGTWLVDMVAHAAAGADVVLGTVRPDDTATAALAAAWSDAHSLADGHPHVHGANLGISAAAYRTLGGWTALPAHEDRDLVERALARGLRIVRTDRSPVVTSARLQGRAPSGFAAYLQQLSDRLPAVS